MWFFTINNLFLDSHEDMQKQEQVQRVLIHIKIFKHFSSSEVKLCTLQFWLYSQTSNSSIYLLVYSAGTSIDITLTHPWYYPYTSTILPLHIHNITLTHPRYYPYTSLILHILYIYPLHILDIPIILP